VVVSQRSRFVIAILFGAPLVRLATAQTAAPERPLCSYDTCALHVEENRILKGSQGVEVGRLRTWSATAVLPLVGASDSARYYATRFDGNYGAGTRWTTISAVAAGVGFAFLFDRDHSGGEHWNGNDWAWLAGFAVSIGTGAYGAHRLQLARRGLARAIWWRNRELTR
jgi:hypothetical protein